jgi:20S proteasome alpha/beta subunit
MTVCVAVLCDEGRAVVLASDKRIGKGYIEEDLQISKLQVIHPHWIMMMSGDDISPLFDLADRARDELPSAKEASLEVVTEVLQRNYEMIRMKRAEAEHLKPLGWTTERFTKEGSASLPNYEVIQSRLREYELSVEILVAGFDRKLSPPAKIFTMLSAQRGIPIRHDIPGFAAIGSGSAGAEFMLFYKDVGQKLPIRAAVYYALEAKYFGEHASGVGEATDMYVMQFDGTFVRMIQISDEKTIEKKLIPICDRLEPRHPGDDDIKILNSLPELKGLPPLPLTSKKKRNVGVKKKTQ